MFKSRLLKSILMLFLITTVFISCFNYMPSMAIQEDNNISLNMRDADIRDVLSALAVNMGKNIIYTADPINVNISIEGVDSKTAMTYLLSTYSMDYLEDNNTLIIGDRETLTTEFYNKLSMSKFVLKYVTSDIISKQLDALEIPVQKVLLDSNKFSGYKDCLRIWLRLMNLFICWIKQKIYQRKPILIQQILRPLT